MNQKIVICINREYGSGGRTIGEMLSEDLGIHYYDKEILKLASDDSGINQRLFEQADAKFRGTTLFRAASWSAGSIWRTAGGLSTTFTTAAGNGTTRTTTISVWTPRSWALRNAWRLLKGI